jgi:hypothetical protein
MWNRPAARHHKDMTPTGRSPFGAKAFACWNWKCALMSAGARSAVYLISMLRPGHAQSSSAALSVVLVEMAYVTVTAGLYAGLQQRALSFRSRFAGNLTVVIGVPGLAQLMDWLTHQVAGAPAPGKATLAVCVFAAISAFFHLHVMRRGAFLTGQDGRSLADDFRRMPRLAAGFVAAPVLLVASLGSRLMGSAGPEVAS